MKDKINVLYFMDGIGNGGGIQEMTVKWMENIDAEKVQIDILSYNKVKPDNYKDRIETLGGHIYIIQTYISKKYFFKSFCDLNKFFKEHHDYDIIHAHSSSKAIFVMLFAKIYGIKVRILHSHSSRYTMVGAFALLAAKLFQPITKILSTDFFACSMEAGRFLFGAKEIESQKVTIVHNAVNTDAFIFNPSIRKKIRQELNIETKIVIGNVGRFRPVKNHSFLLDIFKSVCDMESNAVLLLIGNGELENIIKNHANKLKIDDKIIFLGYRSDVDNLMQAMDILVMPSLYEGLPVTAIEAQAEGLPCVFSDTITKEAKVLDEGAFISLNDSTDIWAKKILNIVKNYKRTDTKKNIIDKGYDIITETKKMEDLYIELIKKGI